MARTRTFVAAAGVACVATLLALLLEWTGVLRFVDRTVYDLLTVAKVSWAPPAGRAPVSIIALDDATLDDPAYGAPLSFWHRKFVLVLEALADAPAAVAGLDLLLPQVVFDSLEPEFAGYSAVWLDGLARARRGDLRIVASYVQSGRRLLVPALPYRLALGPDGLALANLRTDPDDHVRRHVLWHVDEGGREVPSFALAVARGWQRELRPPARELAIEFLPPAGAFPMWSFREVHARAAAGDAAWMRERFAGRMVLLGANNTLDKDFVATPLQLLPRQGQRKLSGVEVHAQIINTLLAVPPRTVLPPWATPLLVWGMALMTAWGVLAPGRGGMLAALPACAALLAAGTTWLFLRGVELPAVPMGAALVLGGAGALLWREYGMERDKRRLRRLFQRYLPPHVVDRLAETADADFFKGERRELCILLSDIRGFTTWSKDRPPQEVVARLNEYFDAMTRVVQRHGGVVDKFLGDGVLAFFGIAPVPAPADAASAGCAPADVTSTGCAPVTGAPAGQASSPSLSGARAALEMLQALESLNAAWAARGEETFRIGLGLHTGPVMVGNIGSQDKSEFTVIGDPVNVASRLQSMTKELGRPILVTQAFRDAVESCMVLEDMGEVAVRGHSSMRAFALCGVRPTPEA